MTDLYLALAHHFLAFGLAAILAAETALLRPALDDRQLRRLGALDATYGGFALLLLVVGFGRVFSGVRGAEFFLSNPWFWAKIAAFVIVAALSAPPTIRFIVWRWRRRTDPAFAITAADVSKVRRFMVAEIVVFAFIPLLAAAMVRVPLL